MDRKLYRSRSDKVLGGVCGGLAEYFDVDPVLIRVLFVAVTLGGGAGILAYIILWIVMPQRPIELEYAKGNLEEEREDGEIENIEDKKSFERGSSKGKLYAGAALITIGGLWFLEEILPDFDFDLVYPAALILIGLIILLDVNEKGGVRKRNENE